ncbi:MAG: choice-of-anchor Q domain-containing protein [Kiritimatiellae bacterium]|nr:choice-of-anchor Q domain-containing protein [Kiritimatiellia bacterium]
MKRRSLIIAWMAFGTAFMQRAAAVDWYVALDGTGQGTSGWANATNDLQGAIDACHKGDTVWVSNGVYRTGGRIGYPAGSVLSNRVVIAKAITVRSLSNDPAQTVIRGNWDPDTTNGPAAVRCVYMSFNESVGASLIGFTLTNGATLSSTGNAGDDQRGGGIFAYSSWGAMVISNCIIAGNSAAGQGGGAYGGKLHDSVIAGNAVRTDSPNYNSGAGGGVCAGKLYDCLLTGNSGSYGSAASGGTLTKCLVVNNMSAYAVYAGTLYNCLIVSNTSANAVRAGKIYNCTIANNTSYGADREAVFFNSIVYFNTSGNVRTAENSWTNSCTTPAQTGWVTGDGNITNAPLFVNRAAGDYRLNRDSPCINAGTNGSWTTSVFDLDGHQRIDTFSGLVDMGCYEYAYLFRGTIWTVR